jgi:GNAT superfamily N-acetyltransferase
MGGTGHPRPCRGVGPIAVTLTQPRPPPQPPCSQACGPTPSPAERWGFEAWWVSASPGRFSPARHASLHSRSPRPESPRRRVRRWARRRSARLYVGPLARGKGVASALTRCACVTIKTSFFFYAISLYRATSIYYIQYLDGRTRSHIVTCVRTLSALALIKRLSSLLCGARLAWPPGPSGTNER